MSSDGFWQVFADTGDPLCWLMTRDGQQYTTCAPDAQTPVSTNNASDGMEPSE